MTQKIVISFIIGFLLSLLLFNKCNSVSISKTNLNALKPIFDSLEHKAKLKNKQIAELKTVNDSLLAIKAKVKIKYITIKDTITLVDRNDSLIYIALTDACDTLINAYESVIDNDKQTISNLDTLVSIKEKQIDIQKKEINLHIENLKKQKKKTINAAVIGLGVGIIGGFFLAK
jgi:C-terminal processing protease CtpA/Prc